MFGVSPLEMTIVAALLFGGGATSAVGVPMPVDATLEAAAPAECLAYFAAHGVATPHAASTNHVEQLYAEEEIQAFLGEMNRLVGVALQRIPAGDEQQRAAIQGASVLAKAFLTRPNILYVTDVAVPPEQPSVNGALVLNAGDQLLAVQGALEDIERFYLTQVPPGQQVTTSSVGKVELRSLPMPPGAPPVVWGVAEPYVFLAVGKDEPKQLVGRLTSKGTKPEWLTKLNQEFDIKRPSSLAMIDAAAIWEIAEPLLNEMGGTDGRQIAGVLNMLGIKNFKNLAFASGLDETVAVNKLLMAYSGDGDGLFAAGTTKPLTVADLKRLPKSADFATLFRFDAKETFDWAMKLAAQFDPEAPTQVRGMLGLAAQQLGFSIEQDLLAGLGDTWSLYTSANEGGMLLTGGCLAVSVRDRAKIEKCLNQGVMFAQVALQDRRGQATFEVRKATAGDNSIHFIQAISSDAMVPVAPAWCLTEDTLLIALSPQMLRAHLSRPASVGTLADVPALAQRLSTGDVTSISYQDSVVGLQLGYSYAQMGLTMGVGALEKETGIRADISKLPSLACIMRHMQPTIGINRSTKAGAMFESYSTGPTIGGLTVPIIGVGAGLLVPAIAKAREMAEERR
jgi:hypothetical protein